MPHYHHPLGRPCVRANLAKDRGRLGEVERIEKIDGRLELCALGEELDRLSSALRSRAKHAVGEQISFAGEFAHAASVLSAARGEPALLVRDGLVVARLRVPENKKRSHASMVGRVASRCNPENCLQASIVLLITRGHTSRQTSWSYFTPTRRYTTLEPATA